MNSKYVRVALILLGLFHTVNGLAMLAAPGLWYASVPGVSSSGPANPHFIIDIGLAFLASGAGLLMAFHTGIAAATAALAGSVWPALHGLFHAWEWIEHGIPRDPQLLVSDALAVMFASLLGVVLAGIWAKREGAI